MGFLPEGTLLVRDLMSKEIIAVAPEASIGDAISRMEDHEVHELPVMSNSSLRGWISYDELRRRPTIDRNAKVSTVMVSPPRVPKTMEASEAANLMLRNNVRALPVVDPKGMVVGVLSRTDLLQAVYEVPALARLRLERVMTRELETVTEKADIDQVASRLRHLHINQLLVLGDQGKLVGYVAEEDILHAVSQERNAARPHGGRGAAHRDRGRDPPGHHVTIQSLVREAPTLPATATLADAIDLMRKAHGTFVAVTSDGFAVGVVSRANIVERFALLQAAPAPPIQIIGLNDGDNVDIGDLETIRSLATETLEKAKKATDVLFLSLHYKVYKVKPDGDGDQKYAVTAHLDTGHQFFVQKQDDWNLIGATKAVLDLLEQRVHETKELRLDRRKRQGSRRAAMYRAS